MTETTSSNGNRILDIRNLKTFFFLESGLVRAVDGVDVTLDSNVTLGLVGESGCGKSVTARSVMQLIQSPPGKIVEGDIFFYRNQGQEVVEITNLDPKGPGMRRIRGGQIAMVFQEPMTSLNPLFTVGSQIAEAVELHQGVSSKEASDRALEMLDRVRIGDPQQRLKEYPHQLSGGMRQRVMIAMALACNPHLMIADEPTTALDVTIQAQILDLMNTLKADTGAAILFITHDLGVIAEMAQRVAVMYAGNIVEYTDVKTLYANPKHPYTIGLLESIPARGRKAEDGRLNTITGMVPSLFNLPEGCLFNNRCPDVFDQCRELKPEMESVGENHIVRCFKYV